MGDNSVDDSSERQKLAARLTVAAIGGITVISLAVIWLSEKRGEAAEHVMASVLPLFGSWVATVLAYYFARENLRAATSSVSTLLASRDAALDTMSRDKMIDRTRIVSLSEKFTDLPNTTLKDILAFLDLRRVSRSPIFDKDGRVTEIVHVRRINDFISQQMVAQKPVDTLKYAELQADPKLGPLMKTSIAFVAESATLADARMKMTARRGCEDVFVTKSGSPEEPVLGWITDNVILEASK